MLKLQLYLQFYKNCIFYCNKKKIAEIMQFFMSIYNDFFTKKL